MPIKKNEDRKTSNDFVAGALAGAICGIIFQPLDVLKINLIVSPNNYEMKNRNSFQNLFNITKMIYEQRGWKGFWLGTAPSVIRTSLSCAIYFKLLRVFDLLSERRVKNNRKYISDFLDSGLSRVITSLITNPLNVVKTQWTLLNNDMNNKQLIRSLIQLFKLERSKIFIIGTVPMICEEFLYGGIFNLIYEYLNRMEHVQNRKYKYRLVFLNGLFAGLIGGILTQPFDIARTKIQSNQKHWHPPHGKNLVWHSLKHVYNKHGWSGFLNGFYPRLLKKTLMAASTFSLYELIRKRNIENYFQFQL